MSAGEGVTFQTGDPATPPALTVVATDLIGGANYQRVKITWGADGTANDANAATPLPVDIGSATVTVAGTITANQGGAWTVAATQSGTWNVGTLTSITNVVHVDDNAGSLTVDNAGTFAVQASQAGAPWSINQTQWAGTAVDVNSGTKSAGTLRVVLATDQPALTNKLLVTPDANSAVNISQMNGVTVTMGNGVSGTGVQRVTLASDSTGQVALAAGTNTVGKTSIAFQTTKALTHASVSFSSSGDNTVVSGTASQTIRVFKLVLIAASPVNVTIKDGAGTSLTGSLPLTANGSVVVDAADGEPEFITSSGNGFVVNLGSAVAVTGWVQYTKS